MSELRYVVQCSAVPCCTVTHCAALHCTAHPFFQDRTAKATASNPFSEAQPRIRSLIEMETETGMVRRGVETKDTASNGQDRTGQDRTGTGQDRTGQDRVGRILYLTNLRRWTDSETDREETGQDRTYSSEKGR